MFEPRTRGGAVYIRKTFHRCCEEVGKRLRCCCHGCTLFDFSVACHGSVYVMPSRHFFDHGRVKPWQRPRQRPRIVIGHGAATACAMWLCPRHVPWNLSWLLTAIPRHVPRQPLHGKHQGNARGNAYGKLRGISMASPTATFAAKPPAISAATPRGKPRGSVRGNAHGKPWKCRPQKTPETHPAP